MISVVEICVDYGGVYAFHVCFDLMCAFLWCFTKLSLLHGIMNKMNLYCFTITIATM